MEKKLGFRHSSPHPFVPDYLSKEELLSASKDCLSWNDIETDTQKIQQIINELKDRNLFKTDFDDDNVCSQDDIFGFLIYNKKNDFHEIALFLKDSSDLDWGDVAYIQINKEETEGYYYNCDVISSSPLLITTALGNTWGFIYGKTGIEEVEVCSPEIDLYDWKPAEEWVGIPYIRKPD